MTFFFRLAEVIPCLVPVVQFHRFYRSEKIVFADVEAELVKIPAEQDVVGDVYGS